MPAHKTVIHSSRYIYIYINYVCIFVYILNSMAAVSLVAESSRRRQQTIWLNFHALLQVPDFVTLKSLRVPVAARENNQFLDIVYIYYTLICGCCGGGGGDDDDDDWEECSCWKCRVYIKIKICDVNIIRKIEQNIFKKTANRNQKKTSSRRNR